MKLEHVLLVGLNFQNKRGSGDKNFWVDIIPLLARHLKQITIFSIKEHIVKREEYFIDECKIVIKFLSPFFLESPESVRKKIFWRTGAFPSWLGVIEKASSINKIQREMICLFKENPYQHIHLMDNMGIGNRLIVKNSKVPVTVSAMAYVGKSPAFFYDSYLRLSYGSPGLTVVPYNGIFCKKLIDIGVNPKNICAIPWGVYTDKRPVISDSERPEIKRRLGIDSAKPLVLWAGYIQQIGRRDFFYAYQVAKSALQNGLKATFFFAFKPETFESSFMKLTDPHNGIIIKSTDRDEFQDLKRCCHAFFSPVLNKKCILAPPLTWIELLNNGVPIITTPIPGAEDVIILGKTGFFSWIPEELIDGLKRAFENYSTMHNYCIELANSKFNIETSADNYLKLFNKEFKEERYGL